MAEVLGVHPDDFRRQRQGGGARAILVRRLVEQAELTWREAAGVMGTSPQDRRMISRRF